MLFSSGAQGFERGSGNCSAASSPTTTARSMIGMHRGSRGSVSRPGSTRTRLRRRCASVSCSTVPVRPSSSRVRSRTSGRRVSFRAVATPKKPGKRRTPRSPATEPPKPPSPDRPGRPGPEIPGPEIPAQPGGPEPEIPAQPERPEPEIPGPEIPAQPGGPEPEIPEPERPEPEFPEQPGQPGPEMSAFDIRRV